MILRQGDVPLCTCVVYDIHTRGIHQAGVSKNDWAISVIWQYGNFLASYFNPRITTALRHHFKKIIFMGLFCSNRYLASGECRASFYIVFALASVVHDFICRNVYHAMFDFVGRIHISCTVYSGRIMSDDVQYSYFWRLNMNIMAHFGSRCCGRSAMFSSVCSGEQCRSPREHWQVLDVVKLAIANMCLACDDSSQENHTLISPLLSCNQWFCFYKSTSCVNTLHDNVIRAPTIVFFVPPGCSTCPVCQCKGTVTGVWKTCGIPTGHVSP